MLKAFLSYPYKDEIKDFVDLLHNFLEEQDIEVVDGKWPSATDSLSEQIKLSIKESNILVAVLIDSLESRWVDHEVGYAIGAGLDVIIVYDGEVLPSGIIGDQYCIKRTTSDMALATSLSKTLKIIRKKLGATSGIPLSSNAPIDEILTEGWSDAIRDAILLLRNDYFAQARFEEAIGVASSLIVKHPSCWRFYIAKSSALIHTRRFLEATNALAETIAVFGNNPRALSYAYDNRGWLKHIEQTAHNRKSLESELEEYKVAIQHEPRFITYVNEVQCLLELGRTREAEREFFSCLKRFPWAVPLFQKQVEVQGSDFVKNLSKSDLISTLIFPKKE